MTKVALFCLTIDNREYVDARLVELKRELAILESKRLELEATGAKKIEIGRLIDQAVELAGDFKLAFTEGTIEEKRLFLRAFLKGIELDPTKGVGRAMFILLPGIGKTVKEVCTVVNVVIPQPFNNI